METTTLLLLCFATFTIPLANGQVKQDPITCTAGNFTRTPSASITCHFNQDIKKNKKNFNVVQYPHKTGDGPSNDAGNYVLVCNWGEGDSLQCKVEDGYTFDEQVSDTLTLGIPAVKSSVGGVYVCQMVPDGGISLQTCALNVLDALPPASGGYCPSPVSCPDSSSNQGILIVVLIVVLIVLIILAVFVVVYVRMHYRLEKKSGDPDHDRCGFCGLTLTLARKPNAQAAPSAASTTPHTSKVTSRDGTDNVEEAKSLIEEAEEAAETLEDSNPALLPLASSEKVDKPPATGSLGGGNINEPTGSSKNQPPRTDNRTQGDRGRSEQARDRRDDQKPRQSAEDKRATGNQRGEGRTQNVESGPSVSPPGPQSAYRTVDEKAEPQPLQDNQCDTWTADQVCAWLTQEGLGIHVKCFENKKVDGKRLLSFNYETGLQYFVGMGSGPDGKDRGRLIAKIEELRRQVATRQEREEQERKERERKNQKK